MKPAHPYVVTLGRSAVADAQALVSELAERYPTVEDERLQAQAPVLAQELPRELRQGLYDFRLSEPSCLCVVRTYPVDDGALGPTPTHWRHADPAATRTQDIFFLLCASLLGEPIAWSTKQDGRLMHTIAPVRGDEDKQLASSSQTPLTWHTEDAFHPLRADYLGLMCLRNPDGVATTASCTEVVDVSAEHRGVLSEARFTIRPDGSHLGRAAVLAQHAVPVEAMDRARARIRAMDTDPQPIALLFGDPESPYLRLDQEYAAACPDDPAAAEALAALVSAVHDGLSAYAMAPGELCFIDNYRAVHGREAFTARHDGTDRWLRRLNITRDLRGSRANRMSAGSRLIL